MKIQTIKTIAMSFVFSAFLVSCTNQTPKNTPEEAEVTEESFETAEPTLLGKWKLRNFEMNGVQKFDECDANTIWNFTEDFVSKHEGKNQYKLISSVEDPACRLYGFNAEWEETNGKEVYITNVKVGKGTNQSGTFKIEELTTKTLKLKNGQWTYFLER